MIEWASQLTSEEIINLATLVPFIIGAMWVAHQVDKNREVK